MRPDRMVRAERLALLACYVLIAAALGLLVVLLVEPDLGTRVSGGPVRRRALPRPAPAPSAG